MARRHKSRKAKQTKHRYSGRCGPKTMRRRVKRRHSKRMRGGHMRCGIA